MYKVHLMYFYDINIHFCNAVHKLYLEFSVALDIEYGQYYDVDLRFEFHFNRFIKLFSIFVSHVFCFFNQQ